VTTRLALASTVALATLLLAGCGSKSSEPDFPTIGRARTFQLANFQPAGRVEPGRPTTLAFSIRQPDGSVLKTYRRGAGPHTGIHLIIVSKDLRRLIHRHPPVAKDGSVRQQVTFPAAGTYRVVVDAYPRTAGPQRNFQLFKTIRVGDSDKKAALPPFASTVRTPTATFTLTKPPRLKAIEASSLEVDVVDRRGRPARFTPYYGALAHAIFFRQGTLDYFHSHVCGQAASACASPLGGAPVAGTSTAPGKLKVGVLVPTPGTWRLFLQARIDGTVETAPFTLRVR